MENYLIDNLDRGILEALMGNARTAYAELAKQFGVSPGTIHVRVEKMKQAGIITGARIDVSPKQLGYDVGCFIGIILKSAKDYPSALAKLESLDEVTEAYYTTVSSFRSCIHMFQKLQCHRGLCLKITRICLAAYPAVISNPIQFIKKFMIGRLILISGKFSL